MLQPSAAALDALPLFHGIEEERTEILAAGKIRDLAKGDILFRHGDKPGAFHIVLDGAVRQFRETPDGKETTLGLAMRGEMVGDSHLFDSCAVYQWNATAIEATKILEYPIAWFKEKLKLHSILALNMLSAISRQSHINAIDAEHLKVFSAAQRVACFLLRLCVLYEFKPHGFDLPYSKGTIASKLGMGQGTFSRILQKLSGKGVHMEGTHVSIDKLSTLEIYACDHCSISENCQTRQEIIARVGGSKDMAHR